MNNSWDGAYYAPDQSHVEDVLQSLDLDAIAQQYGRTPQTNALARQTFPTPSQDYFSAASAPQRPSRSPLRPADSAIAPQTNYAPAHAPSPGYSSPTQIQENAIRGSMRPFPSYASLPSTPNIHSPSSLVPSQQFKPFVAAYESAGDYSSFSLKRSQKGADVQAHETQTKRRRSHDTNKQQPEPTADDMHPPDLSEDEQLLIKLKQEQNLPWKEISREFEQRLGRPYQVPALQMRYKRLRERLRLWTDEDVVALEAAHNYWERYKYEIIAQKMLDLGIHEKWPARLVEKRWLQLHPEDVTSPATAPVSIHPTTIGTIPQDAGGGEQRGQAGFKGFPNLPEGADMPYDLGLLANPPALMKRR